MILQHSKTSLAWNFLPNLKHTLETFSVVHFIAPTKEPSVELSKFSVWGVSKKRWKRQSKIQSCHAITSATCLPIVISNHRIYSIFQRSHGEFLIAAVSSDDNKWPRKPMINQRCQHWQNAIYHSILYH